MIRFCGDFTCYGPGNSPRKRILCCRWGSCTVRGGCYVLATRPPRSERARERATRPAPKTRRRPDLGHSRAIYARVINPDHGSGRGLIRPGGGASEAAVETWRGIIVAMIAIVTAAATTRPRYTSWVPTEIASRR